MERSELKILLKRLIAIAITVILCEIFIFNYASISSLIRCKNEVSLDLAGATLHNIELTDDGRYCVTGPDAYIRISDINTNVNTLYINAHSTKEQLQVKFSYNDETITEALRTNGYVNIISGNEHSKFSLCSFSGNVDIFKFYFDEGEGENVIIESIIINKKIPFQFSIIRVLAITLPIALFLSLFSLSVFKRPIGEILNFKYSTAGIITICCLAVLMLTCYASDGIINDLTKPDENQINKELVDAFEAGQVHLLREPEEELLQLENPYDRSQRTQSGGDFAWDHCYYNGHYYSYYGIAPVLLLFLPYHLITGAYFPSLWAISIFSLLGVIFLGLTYYEIIKKHFPEIPLRIAISGMLILEFSSGIWFSTPVSKFYEIAQSSGFAFVTMGAYFMIRSCTLSNGSISKLSAALSSVFLALAVLCRPTLAVYCIVALLFIFFGAKKVFKENGKKSLASYLTCSLLPFIVIGSIQMIYNYLRFDSVFDFGIQYSLTINDFTKAEFHLPLVLTGFHNFIFAFPKASTSFPFIHSNYDNLQLNGFYFSANDTAVGILYRALPVFAYLMSGKAYKLSQKNKKCSICIAAGCIIAPAIIIFSIWESGYGVRYCADFSWQIVIGALIISYLLYVNSSKQHRSIADKIMALSLVLCIAINFAIIYEYIFELSSVSFKSQMLSFGRLFELTEIF